ncbi:MAG: efflux RND transporter periplasmic adaptor subunit, partial [Caulobacter sp.]
VTVLDRTRTNTLDQGAFSTLDNLVDTGTGTVKGKARFPNTGGKLFPSQFVNVRIQLDTIKDAVVVPATAVRQGSDGSFVWKLKSDQTVTKTKVKTGQSTTTQVAITEGLAIGDKVITEGGDRLTEGGTVQLPGQAAQRMGEGKGKKGKAGPNGGGEGRRRPE